MQTFMDYDGTLIFTMHDWVDWINEKEGTSYTISDVLSWDWVTQIQKKLNIDVFSFFDDSEPYKLKETSLQPIPGSLKFLMDINKLSEKYSPKILTATHDDSLKEQKNIHAEHYFPGIEVIHEKDKFKYAICDIENEPCFLFDDKASSCEKWVETGGYGILYTHNGEYPYAKTEMIHPRMKVADTYDEALLFIKEVMKSHQDNKIPSTLSESNEYKEVNNIKPKK